jgi:hypothetical protein
MDEVPVSFDLPGSRTVHLKGAKEVSVATTGHDCDSDEDFVGFE